MYTATNFDNHGGRHSSTPSSPLPPNIEEILAQQQARMDELLEQERARNRRELAKALKAASKAQEGRIHKKMRREVIDEELPRIRLLLKQELAPLVMAELKVENARAAPNNDRQDNGRTTSHNLDSWDRSYRSPERVESQHRHQSRSRRQGRLEQQRSGENSDVWHYERRCSVNEEDSETKRAILLPSERQAPPRGLRRSSSEAQLDGEEETHMVGSYGSKRVRTGPGPISMRRFSNISYQPSLPSRSPRRHITRPQPRQQLSPLSRAAQAYLQVERAIPSIENDGPQPTKEQMKDAERCLSHYTRFTDEGQGDDFVPSNSDSLPKGNLGVGRPLTPIIRHNGVGSEDDLLPDNLTRPSWSSLASPSIRTAHPHGAPPLHQLQKAENTLGLIGRMPHGWYASRTDILQKTLERFPYKKYGLSSEFIPLLVYYNQRHILIECEGFYFFWHEPTNYLEEIHRPQELQEILKQMDEGRLLPHRACLPAHSVPLASMELIRAENLRYWSTPVVLHRRRSSIDLAAKKGIVCQGSDSIHESNANNLNKRDGENGDNPDALNSRYLDNTQGALVDRDSREPGYDGYDPSSENNYTQEAIFDRPAAIISSFEEGTTLNSAINLISSPSTLQGSPARSNLDRNPDAYQLQGDHVPGALRHRNSKALSDKEFGEREMEDTYHDWDNYRESSVDWEQVKEQLTRDEEQYP